MKEVIGKIPPSVKLLLFFALILCGTVALVLYQSNTTNQLQTVLEEKNAQLSLLKNRPTHYTEEDNEYFESLQTLSDIAESSDISLPQKVNDFLTEYDERMDYNFTSLKEPSEMQIKIGEQFSDIFTDFAFEKSAEYHKMQLLKQSESKKDDEAFRGTLSIIPKQSKDIVRKYISSYGSGAFGVVLMVEDFSRYWEYQKLTIMPKDNTFIITDIEYLKF